MTVIPPAEWRTIDHMGKPREGKAVPADDAPCHLKNDRGWNFTSTGLRVTSMLVSPWVQKGAVIQEPKGPTSTSQFELSSIPATIRNLFNLTLSLTQRDTWAGTFDELLLDAPRTDSPMWLPDPPTPAKPWSPPPPERLEQDTTNPIDGNDTAGASPLHANEPVPQHCGREDGVCRGSTRESVSQRRRMEWISHRGGLAPPAEELTHAEAHAWLNEQWQQLLLTTTEGTPPITGDE